MPRFPRIHTTCVNRDIRAIETAMDEVHDITGWRRIMSAAGTPQLSGRGYEKTKVGPKGYSWC